MRRILAAARETFEIIIPGGPVVVVVVATFVRVRMRPSISSGSALFPHPCVATIGVKSPVTISLTFGDGPLTFTIESLFTSR